MAIGFLDYIDTNQGFYKTCENYLYFGGHRYFVLEVRGHEILLSGGVEMTQNLLMTVFKILSFVTVVIPIIMLMGKMAYRIRYSFSLMPHHEKVEFLNEYFKHDSPLKQSYIRYKYFCYTMMARSLIYMQKSDLETADLYYQSYGLGLERGKFRLVRNYIEDYARVYRQMLAPKIVEYLYGLSQAQDEYIDKIFERIKVGNNQPVEFKYPKLIPLTVQDFPFSSYWLPSLLEEEYEFYKWFVPI